MGTDLQAKLRFAAFFFQHPGLLGLVAEIAEFPAGLSGDLEPDRENKKTEIHSSVNTAITVVFSICLKGFCSSHLVATSPGCRQNRILIRCYLVGTQVQGHERAPQRGAARRDAAARAARRQGARRELGSWLVEKNDSNLCWPRSGKKFFKFSVRVACWLCITPIPTVPQPHFSSLRQSANAQTASPNAH